MSQPMILVVDPQVDRLTRIADALGEDFGLVLVTSAEDAVKRARTEQPAAIVLDFPLPLGDGRCVTEALRSEPSTRGIPVVAYSGWEHAKTRARAESLGCAAFVGHSEGLEELAEQLEGLTGLASGV